MERQTRSVTKAASWRVVATGITTLLVYLFTRDLAIAGSVGMLEVLVKLVAYYLHERAWNRIGWGVEGE